MGTLIEGIIVVMIISLLENEVGRIILGCIVICLVFFAVKIEASNAEKKEKVEQAYIRRKIEQKQRETEEIEQHCENGKKLLEQINIIVVQAVLEHLQTLDIKYQQSIYKDDYGYVEENSWLKEIEYFVSKVVSPILAKKITDKQNSYALPCSSYRTKFLFPQQFDWAQLKDYKTLIDLEFLDKRHNVITFNKTYLKRSISILDGYADLI